MSQPHPRSGYHSRGFHVFLIALLFMPAGLLGSNGAQRVTSGLIARGLPSETPYYIRDTNAEGPTVLIIGGMHGNEPAGAEAAEHIRHWPITRGRLVVIPRANPPALIANTRYIPGKPKKTGNLNRNFPATNPARDVRGPTAENLWEFITVLKPDWVLDLHEGYDWHAANPKSVGSSIIHINEPGTTSFVIAMVETVNADIEDENKHFQRVDRGPVDSGLARAAIVQLGARGMILETTWKEQPLSVRARQHRQMVHTLLRELEMVDVPWHVVLPPRGQTDSAGDEVILRVALYDDAGTGGEGVPNITRLVKGMPDAVLRYVCGADIRDGALEQFDVVVFPGGSGGGQGRNLGEVGRQRVRAFLQDGGGYVGICAGAYLATCRVESYLMTVRAFHHQPWRKGRGQVLVQLTEAGRELLGGDDSPIAVRYANGPIFFHEDGDVPDLDLPDFEVLAQFTLGVQKDGQRQTVMEGTPAIIAAPFGEGRLLLVSPHPESNPELDWLLTRGLKWAGGKCETDSSKPSEARPVLVPAAGQ